MGLHRVVDALVGRDEPVALADVAVPPTVYERVGIGYRDPFGAGSVVELVEV